MNNDKHTPSEKPILLVISGAGLNSSVWKEAFRQMPYAFCYLDYPRENTKKLSFRDYGDHLIKQIDRTTSRNFVLVVHSIGGLFINAVAAELTHRMIGIISVGAITARRNEDFFSEKKIIERQLMRSLIRIAGTKPPEKAIKASLCNDLSDIQATQIVSKFKAESAGIYLEKVQQDLPDTPAAAFILTADKSLSASEQEKYVEKLNLIGSISFDSGHLPMVGRPKEFREEVLKVIEKFINN